MATKRVIRTRGEHSTLDVVDGKVVPTVIPAEEIEMEVPDESAKPQIKFKTPQGEAIYEYAGDCFDCKNQKDSKGNPIITPVFVCISHPIRADEQVGERLAAFRGDGSVICMPHYQAWVKPYQQAPKVYEVLDKRW